MLTLEQSQQGVSNDVLVSIEGVEELKRNVWIKGGSLLQPPITKTKSAQIESRARRDQMKMEILLEPTSNKLLVGLNVTDEEVDEKIEEVELEDIIEYVGPEHVGVEDVIIPHLGVEDTFLNKLVDGKYIRNHDIEGNLGRNSTSLRDDELDDNEVDERFMVKEGDVYHVYDPNVPWNEMQPSLGMKLSTHTSLKNV
ncbi:hypothetical protein Tco_1425209 [Tanacetum coccineum]